MERLRDFYQFPFLAVDAGNLLFKNERIAPALLPQMTITAEGIMEAYNLMQYSAVAVGSYDLGAGLPFLKELASRSKFTWLSANLVHKSNRNTVFSPGIIRKAGDLTVGIIGLTGSNRKVNLQENDNAVVLPWQDVLPDLIADMSTRCDLLILLSNSSLEQNQKIAQNFEDIHIIVQSFPQSSNYNPNLISNSLLTKTGKQGKYLGWMEIDWQKSKIWGRKGAIKELSLKKQELDGVNGRISRMERRAPDEDLASNSAYRNLLRNKERLQSSIIFLENELHDLKKSGHAPSTFDNSFVALDIELPDQPEVEKIVQRVKKNVNLAGRNKTEAISKLEPLSLEKLPFTGWQRCAQCHKPQTDFWERTDHATSYTTLVEQEQQFNLNCLPCHVTARYGTTRISDDESVLLSLPPVLQQVGCEVCHGPGKAHAASGDPSSISRKPAPETCLRCHTPDNDDNFSYENDLERVACPASKRE
jgi:hypothetical protein